MNILLFFFSIPIAIIIISIALERLLDCPVLVADITFAVLLVIATILGSTTFLIAVIIYTIISFLAAWISRYICRWLRNIRNCCNNNSNNCNNNNVLTVNGRVNIADETNNNNNNNCNNNNSGTFYGCYRRR